MSFSKTTILIFALIIVPFFQASADYSDTETTSGGSIGSSSLDVSINPHLTIANDTCTASGLLPGGTKECGFNVANDGELRAGYKIVYKNT